MGVRKQGPEHQKSPLQLGRQGGPLRTGVINRELSPLIARSRKLFAFRRAESRRHQRAAAARRSQYLGFLATTPGCLRAPPQPRTPASLPHRRRKIPKPRGVCKGSFRCLRGVVGFGGVWWWWCCFGVLPSVPPRCRRWGYHPALGAARVEISVPSYTSEKSRGGVKDPTAAKPPHPWCFCGRLSCAAAHACARRVGVGSARREGHQAWLGNLSPCWTRRSTQVRASA